MPRWQIEKSYRVGSSLSIRASDAVMSLAIFQPGLCRRVSWRQRPTRMTWVSSGTTSLEGGIRVQTPRSSASCRIIHRRKRFRRLHALPFDGQGKK
jgi:hypothetical protein